jgi:tRNA (adenine-N(1)-)-methyltransferase non-catalytic subunit
VQEKYIKRKAKKYLLQIDVLRPTAASICETYFKKDPWKIQYMRHDTLAILLSLANIGAHGDVLLLDDCNGLITGASPCPVH